MSQHGAARANSNARAGWPSSPATSTSATGVDVVARRDARRADTRLKGIRLSIPRGGAAPCSRPTARASRRSCGSSPAATRPTTASRPSSTSRAAARSSTAASYVQLHVPASILFLSSARWRGGGRVDGADDAWTEKTRSRVREKSNTQESWGSGLASLSVASIVKGARRSMAEGGSEETLDALGRRQAFQTKTPTRPRCRTASAAPCSCSWPSRRRSSRSFY